MKSHASMNRIYRLIWSQVLNGWVAVAENARGKGKGTSRQLAAVALSLTMVAAQAAPLGGQVASGTGSISQTGATTTIQQSSQNLSLNWQSFNVASQETVNFAQPSASAIAVNRIFDTNGSQILGHLNANGQVYLINPNGVLFGPGAQVNVGGLVASTLDLNDATLNGNTRSFSGSGTGSIVNQGTLNTTNGGYVALLGNKVSNQGVISAQLGSVALGAGSAATLTFNGNSLLHMQVDQSTLNNLAENRQLIQANGGQVLMSAGAKDTLLASVVNNSGVIEARTVDNHEGVITLLGGMKAGTVNVGGTLDASAPTEGNGGFIETSAAHVKVANDTKVTTAATNGRYGSWLIDPQDFTVAASGGDMTGLTLSTSLTTTPVTLQSSSGGTAGSGNININDAVTWSADTTLTLTASNNISINANITATGNAAGLMLNPNTANGTETASGTGTYSLNNGASITLSGTNPSLSIGGTAYTVINDVNALQAMNGNLAGHYVLGSNIDASATSIWNSGAGFTPIGSTTNYTDFTGTFDGLGHTISGLTINTPSNNDSVGLFSVVGSAGTVRNVGMLGGSITGDAGVGELVGGNAGTISNAYATGRVSGKLGVGGLVGYNSGTASNAYATGNVTARQGGATAGGLAGSNSGTISNAYATGNVSGAYAASSVGGLVGYNSGTISNAYATGNVSGAYTAFSVGGLVGYNYNGTISNAYATGNVAAGTGTYWIGGLVGENAYGTISNAYATGNVSGTSEVGGLAGYNFGTIINSYSNGSVSGTSDVGGLVGFNSRGTISNAYATGSVSGTTDVGGLVGYNYGILYNDGTLSNAFYNVDQVRINGGSLLTAGGIYNAQYQDWISHGQTLDIANYASLPAGNGGYYNVSSVQGLKDMLGFSENPANNFRLTSNIDLSSVHGFFIPYFAGTFDGNSYVISNLVVNVPNDNVGMFGQLTGSVSNLGVVNASVAGHNDVGGLVGYNSSSGTISNAYATGSVSGTSDVGGLVGYNSGGTISNAYAKGSVNGTSDVGGLVGSNDLGGLMWGNGGTISNAYATGSVSGITDIGGLVGNNGGTISNVYATGSVSGAEDIGGLVGINHVSGMMSGSFGTISNAYATGSVSGTTDVGGLVGYMNGGTLSNTFWNSDINPVGIGSGTTTGATGLTTAQMQTASNLAGFNFTTTPGATGNNWVMVDADGSLNNANGATGSTRPMLASEYSTMIGNAHQLQLMTMNLSASYTLAQNIDASATAGTSDVWSSAGFVPVGAGPTSSCTSGNCNPYGTTTYSDHSFHGAFDGLNHSITGLTINLPSSDNVALFGYIAGAMIANVGLVNENIVGKNNVGGLVGASVGSVTDSVTINGITNTSTTNRHSVSSVVSNSTSSGMIGGYRNVGGLEGANAGSISNSYSNASVTASSQMDVGGLVGSTTAGSISNSHYDIDAANINGSHVVGAYGLYDAQFQNWLAHGLVLDIANFGTSLPYDAASGYYLVNGVQGMKDLIGFADATGYKFRLTGNVDLSSVSGYNIPNFNAAELDGAGYVISHLSLDSSTIFKNTLGLIGNLNGGAVRNLNLRDESVTGRWNVGGLIGSNNNGVVTNSSSDGTVRGDFVLGGLVGYNASGGTITGSSNTAKVISTGSNYGESIGGLVGSNDGIVNNSHNSGDVSGVHPLQDAGGLIGKNGASGSVTGSYNDATVTALANSHIIGGLVGTNFGRLSTSYNSGAVTAGDTSTVVGGLIGLNGISTHTTMMDGCSTRSSCPSTVSIVSDSYNSGNVTVGNNASIVGGLIGSSHGTVSNTYSSGAVLAGSGVTNIGGLLGYNDYAPDTSSPVVKIVFGQPYSTYAYSNFSGTVSNSYWNTETPNQPIVGIGLGTPVSIGSTYTQSWTVPPSLVQVSGLTTAQMQTQSSFAGMDFTNTWVMYDGHTYPLLRAFMTPLTVTASDAVKTYDGQAYSGGNGVTYSSTPNGNLLGTVSYSGTSQGAVIANTYGITPGGLYSNQQGYIISYVNGTLTVNPANISVIGTTITVTGTVAHDKVYDGTTTATLTGGTLVGVIAGDALTLNQSGYFATKNVGSNIAVTATDSLGGTVAGNYTLIQPTGLAASITPASLTVAGTTVGNKVYDRTTTATLTGGTLSGVIAGDTVTLNQTGTFATKNVGSNIAVTATDSLGGDSAGNYTLTAPTGLAANITPKSITVAATGVNKVYDGTVIDPATLSSAGVILGDTVNLGYASASFANKNVGANKKVSVTGINATGEGAGNYSLGNTSASTSASITPATLSVTGTKAHNKLYDGKLTAWLTGGKLSGVIAGDTVKLKQSGTFATKDVGTGIAVTATDRLLGAAAGNYTLTEPTGLAANIMPNPFKAKATKVN